MHDGLKVAVTKDPARATAYTEATQAYTETLDSNVC
jgi:hypothetical protein